jgi:hypothetical protein
VPTERRFETSKRDIFKRRLLVLLAGRKIVRGWPARSKLLLPGPKSGFPSVSAMEGDAAVGLSTILRGVG